MVEPHLQAHHQVAVQQSTQTHQHNGAVCRQITKFIGTPGACRDHPATVILFASALAECDGTSTRLQLHFPPRLGQLATNAFSCGLRALRQFDFGFVAKGIQALLTDVFFNGLQVGRNFGRVAGNTQRGAGNQKRQNQQKPPSTVDVVKTND